MNKDIQRLQENVVSSVDQNWENVYFYGDGNGLRIMFVGNSISKHRPLGSWTNDCGMAASSIDKDYVHLLVEKCKREYRENVSFCICQVANYERSLEQSTLEAEYSTAKGYEPDIVIMFFGANVPRIAGDGNLRVTAPEVVERFGKAYELLRNYVVGENTLVFHSDGFYIRPDLDEVKKQIARAYGDTYINIEDIRNRVDTHGLFNHPNDLGMAELADRFWCSIKKRLSEQCPKG